MSKELGEYEEKHYLYGQNALICLWITDLFGFFLWRYW